MKSKVSQQTPRLAAELPYLKKGETRTLLSAGLANQLILLFNGLLKAKGDNIKISKAEAGWRFDVKASAIGESSVQWRGQWDAAEDYVVNDIVIRSTQDELDTGNEAGTYICVTDAPAGTAGPTEPTSGGYWETLARGSWERLTVKNTTTSEKTVVYGGQVTVDLKATVGTLTTNRTVIDKGTTTITTKATVGTEVAAGETPLGAIVLSAAACQSAAGTKKQLYVREVDVCDNGVMKKALVVMCDPYTAGT